MLSLPLSVARGLVKKQRPCNSSPGRVIIYAYPFPGTEKLSLPFTEKNRPRELVSDEQWQAMRDHLRYLGTYDKQHAKQHGEGAGMRRRPTFSIPVEECTGAT